MLSKVLENYNSLLTVFINISSESKISDLADELVSEQDVSTMTMRQEKRKLIDLRSKISVNDSALCKMKHASCYLSGKSYLIRVSHSVKRFDRVASIAEIVS